MIADLRLSQLAFPEGGLDLPVSWLPSAPFMEWPFFMTSRQEDHRSGGSGSPDLDHEESDYHVPVLFHQVMDALQPREGARILDGTMGGGNHTLGLIKRGATVIGLDRDPDAVDVVNERLENYSDQFVALTANYSEMDEIFEEVGAPPLDGILLDLGVSSWQLNTAERGFSFQQDGPLDMRMGPDAEESAADIVNHWEVEDLIRIFRQFGEERRSPRIARAIVQDREKAPFETTLQLAQLIERVKPRQGRQHPATQVFQALRIQVNRELEHLETVLKDAARWLVPGGRLAVITFHSLEDRIVKQFMRHHSQTTLDRPEWPEPRPNPDCFYHLPSRKPINPTLEEISRNPRARSSRLRVAERLPDHL